MSYQVIARKYRPQRFSEVIGQDHVTQTLTNAIAQKRIAHAFLFVGPRGTGKTTIARIFAKCLNATEGPTVDFPEADPRCAEITEGRSLDVYEIDGASNRGIEDIRGLRETVKYAPATSRFKIYIIDEVHMLTKEAFNALLKTLEEPPAHVKFMFATTEPEKVLPTILSRCQRFDLQRIPINLIVSHLGEIAKKEMVEVEEAALFAIARAAEGGMRDAESILDQLISFCGTKISEQEVLSMFGLTDRQHVVSLAESILKADALAALEEINELSKSGKDLARLIADLLTFFRNLLVFRIAKGDPRVVEASESELVHLKSLAGLPNAERDALTRVMEIFSEAEWKIREAASKKIALEVVVLKAMDAARMISIDALVQQLQGLKNVAASSPQKITALERAATNKASAPAVAPIAPSKPGPVQLSASTNADTGATAASPLTAVDAIEMSLEDLWVKLMDLVGKASAFSRTYFSLAHPVSITKKLATIGFDPQHADEMGLVDNPKIHALLKVQLAALGYGQASVKFVLAKSTVPSQQIPASQNATVVPEISNTAPTPAAPIPPPRPATAAAPPPVEKKEKTAPVPFNKDDFKNDPLIQKALEVFKGQIVEVRA